MRWDIECTDEFVEWYQALSESEKDSIDFVVRLLEEKGVQLGYPYSSKIVKAKNHLRELRVQDQGYPYRILYAFDPRKVAILLLGGDKTGQDRWYKKSVPLADKLYDEHIKTLRQEGLIPKPR